MNETQPTGSTTTGPATFAEAFAADASSASNPSPTTPAASTSADATVPPAATGSESATPATGEPPKDRWHDILENARTKTRQEVEAEWKQYEWAKQVNQEEFTKIAELARKASADPIAYLTDYIKELQAHPTYSQQLKSLAARALSQRTQAQGPDLTPIQVQLENGQTVGLYTAEQIAALQQQWLAQAEQKFQPFTQSVEQMQAERAAYAKQQEISQYVETTHADVVTWPGMDDKANQVAVAEELKRMRINDDDPREVSLALNAAWRKVVAPKLSSKGESQLLDTLQRKAAASTSVNPGSTSATSPRAITKFSDLPADAWK